MSFLGHALIAYLVTGNSFAVFGGIFPDMFFYQRKVHIFFHNIFVSLLVIAVGYIGKSDLFYWMGVGMFLHIIVDMFQHPFVYYYFPFRLKRNPLYNRILERLSLGYYFYKYGHLLRRCRTLL